MSTDNYRCQQDRAVERKLRIIAAATGCQKAALVLKNARYINVFSNEICCGDIAVAEGVIAGIGTYSGLQELDLSGSLVLPGFIDAHIHLESAMVAPGEFVRAVLPHGTTTVISDPHEISNVMGVDGISYMLQATEGLPVDVHIMLPSCVPATPRDESGAVLDHSAIQPFYSHPRVLGLAEMMNFPGVLSGDREVLTKLAAAQLHNKRIDGHAPGLTGQDLNAYTAAGVCSDHECYDPADALAKLRRGQVIMIREGTAAHNLQALLPLLSPRYADRCLFCCDDKHPSDLLEKGHIDFNIKEAIRLGADPLSAIKAATWNAARHFQLNDRGAIAPGYLADLVVIDDLENFRIQRVYKNGKLFFDGHTVTDFPAAHVDPALARRARSTFHLRRLTAADLIQERPLGVIGMVAGELLTENRGLAQKIDPARDILKIAVVERYQDTGHIGLGYITGYGLKKGAVATSISHDSHNIIVVGTNEEDMAAAVNQIAGTGGGIVIVEGGRTLGEVRLPIAGIMSDDGLEQVNEALEQAKEAAFSLGVSRSIDPFMTLSFMALPVIPTLRLTTHGMIDVLTQQYL